MNKLKTNYPYDLILWLVYFYQYLFFYYKNCYKKLNVILVIKNTNNLI